MVSSGGGLGRVRLTLRSSELCCRAASWGDGERERETGRREKGGGKAGWYVGEKMYGKGFGRKKTHGTVEQGEGRNDKLPRCL